MLESENFPLDQVSDYLEQHDCLVWADICSPDHAHLDALADELGLDPHAVEDAVGHRERPKATRYATHLFFGVYALRFDPDAGRLSSTQVSAFVTRRGIVTVRQGDDFDPDEVVKTWDANSELIKHGPKALVHGLLDVIVDGHFTAVEALDDEIEAIEDVLFDGAGLGSTYIQRRSFALRKSLVEARRAILPMREVVNTIARNDADDLQDTALRSHYTDLYDHVLRAAEWTESLRDMITTIFETNLSLADTRLNVIMKKLTAWAAIIAVPTAITGFYGQNVPYPGFGAPWGFWLSTLVTVVIAVGLYGSFRKRDWI